LIFRKYGSYKEEYNKSHYPAMNEQQQDTAQNTAYMKPLKALTDLNYTYLKIRSAPRSKHTPSVIKTSQLMLYKEIIAVCSKIHTKTKNQWFGRTEK
jgi:hypothetical protein